MWALIVVLEGSRLQTQSREVTRLDVVMTLNVMLGTVVQLCMRQDDASMPVATPP